MGKYDYDESSEDSDNIVTFILHPLAPLLICSSSETSSFNSSNISSKSSNSNSSDPLFVPPVSVVEPMSASSPMSGSKSPWTSAPTPAVRKPSKSKALERPRQKIHDWFGPPKEAAKIEVPKKLRGIREVKRMYWIHHDIL